MPFQEIAAPRLYQQAAEQVAGMIRSGELAAGSRLPPERDLARCLGISRPVLREALIALEIAGLIETRTGSGSYVASGAPPRSAGLTQAGPSLFVVLAARSAVEGETAALAAGAATPAQAATLATLIEAQRAANGRGGTGHREDAAFHVAVAEMTGNEVLAGIVRQLWDAMASPRYHRLGRQSDGPDKAGAMLADHRRIAEAIAARDRDAARRAMREHIHHAETWLLEGGPVPLASEPSGCAGPAPA